MEKSENIIDKTKDATKSLGVNKEICTSRDLI